MSRPTASLSGFPEWSPAQQLVEEQALEVLRRTFSLHGFTPLHTRSVEPLSVLSRKGEIDKEVYTVARLHADPDAATDDDTLGLHYDLTVPFARYVVERAGHLQFPFRRYQIQKVWRGERPQEGRYREFTQADIDVVGRDTLSFHHEVEMPLVMAEAFAGLRALGPARDDHPGEQPAPRRGVLPRPRPRGPGGRAARRGQARQGRGRRGPARARRRRGGRRGRRRSASPWPASAPPAAASSPRSAALGVRHDLLEQGLDELAAVMDAPGAEGARRGPLDRPWAGLLHRHRLRDDHDGLRAVRLRLLGRPLRRPRRRQPQSTYPGVGISFGLTRTLGLLFGRGLTANRSVPSAVLVALTDESRRGRAALAAQALRARGIATVVMTEPLKFGKQIAFADKRGIPYVWFCGAGEGGGDQVKDIRSGEQVDADVATWAPAPADLLPAVVPG